MSDMKITPEMMKSLEDANQRELEFFKRHGIDDEFETKSGITSKAHCSWSVSVEQEYKITGSDCRVHLDTPLARKAYILGYRMGRRSVPGMDE